MQAEDNDMRMREEPLKPMMRPDLPEALERVALLDEVFTIQVGCGQGTTAVARISPATCTTPETELSA